MKYYYSVSVTQEAELAVHERVQALQSAADTANAEIARMRADADRERAGMEKPEFELRL